LTIPSGSMLSFGVADSYAITRNAPRPPNILRMTALMREQAALAARVFQRTPHPGADDTEPDYGF
jgi:hypothetical protein